MMITRPCIFERKQHTTMENLAALVVQNFPAANSTVKNPEMIVVQAHPDNVGWVAVGTLADFAQPVDACDFLAPGQEKILSGRDESVYMALGSGDGGQALVVKYYSGAS